MDVSQKCAKQMNAALAETRDQKAKVCSSGKKDRLFLSKSDEGGLMDPSNSIRGDEKQKEAAAKQRANLTLMQLTSRPYMRGRVMCEGAKKLSPEEMAALEIDIFKPLDFYEIFFNRTKERSNGRIINNINEL